MNKTPVFLLEGPKTKYEANHKKLSLLPTLSTILMGLIIFFTAIYYFTSVWGVQTSGQGNLNPQSLIKGLPKDNIEVKDEELVENPINQNPENSLIKKIIFNKDKDSCTVSRSNKPANLKTPFKGEIEGWWSAQNDCKDEKLIAIQIVRTNQDITKKLEGVVPQKQIISLSENDIYAIIYSYNHQTFEYNLDDYRDDLTSGIISSLKFDPATAEDTLILGNKTYYLNGKCEGKSNNSCNLWMQNNFNGEVDLVATNAAKTGTSQENELKNISNLRFSSNQDFEAGITIVIVNEGDDSFKLIKLKSPNFEIDSQIEYKPTDPGYNEAKDKYTK